ncbi:MAG: 3-oxoacyl-[acyl-carrier protein] reductase [Candidatus Magnetoglobus multicellularis str. Araruama]|uniref:3-oxoacyl-[acyl-carrier protein] reductase n=1 Tax=Candidatus Magnetoglobus multicellularis str. Araruama TaxID=890399 RepID=A0A1V1P714_9BACT|nr:MAG: 3-oxoacyl-[acyl-carrier protein] reductase [Candidatus Magnetoglobus multicellularis str. Araruama]
MIKNKQKIVLISGGSRGLGMGIVNALLNQGHKVATFSRSITSFIKKCQDLHKDDFLWDAVDGEDLSNLQSFVRLVSSHFGGIDILINNAGVGTDGIMTLTRESDIQRCISLNLETSIYLTRACLKTMLQQRSGCIVNISSVNAIRGHSGVAVYSATKAALDGLTRSLAREVGPEGIRVNSVAPGYFESDMSGKLSDNQRARIIRRTPLKRLANVSDIVETILFLTSDAANFITGQTIIVDGGLTC